METKNEDQEVVLVQQKDQSELKVLGNPKKDGTDPNLKDPKQKNQEEFMRIDKNGNALENFFTNFYRQLKNPTDFNFYRAPLEAIENTANTFKELLKDINSPFSRATIANAKIDPETYLNKPRKGLEPTRINWDELKEMGISLEYLQSSGNLDSLLKWQKSKGLIPINVKVGNEIKQTQARLQFREDNVGGIKLNVSLVRKSPDLDNPFYGIRFTEDDKLNFERTGSAGRVIDIKSGQETIPVLVSIDELTNNLVVARVDKIKIPDDYKGVTLNDIQKEALKNGEEVHIKDMTSMKGSKFDAIVQYNAEKNGLTLQGNANLPEKFVIGNTFMRAEINKKQQENLKSGYSVYIENMYSDKTKKYFSSWLTVNPETNRPKFSKSPIAEAPKPDIKEQKTKQPNKQKIN